MYLVEDSQDYSSRKILSRFQAISQDFKPSVKISSKMRLTLLLVAIWVSSAIASSPTINPDPDRRLDLSGGTDDGTTKAKAGLSTAASLPKCDCVCGNQENSMDKIKFGAEVAFGTASALLVVLSIIWSIKHGESVVAALTRHFPLILRLIEIWRPTAAAQAAAAATQSGNDASQAQSDLIDL